MPGPGQTNKIDQALIMQTMRVACLIDASTYGESSGYEDLPEGIFQYAARGAGRIIFANLSQVLKMGKCFRLSHGSPGTLLEKFLHVLLNGSPT